MSAELSLSIQDLNYAYGRQRVLKNIHLSIEQGFISIIGPNGSGKTTLVKLACGLLSLQSGSVQVWGRNLRELTNLERARCFTLIQQNQAFAFPFTCLEMVSWGRYPHQDRLDGLNSMDYEIIEDAMCITETLELKDRLITEVSGGEQQRVMLACALAQQPKILFLDEAFSAVDISYKKDILGKLKKLVEQKKLTVVSIVHDLNVAYRFSDRVVLLKDGELVGYGHPDEVMNEMTIQQVFQVEVEFIQRRCFVY
jgi:iron complex transport system ATP-binding protein